MDEIILFIISRALANSGVSIETDDFIMDMSRKGLDKIKNLVNTPAVIIIDTLTVSYLKNFKSEVSSSLIVCRYDKLIDRAVLNKKIRNPNSIDQLREQADNTPYIFAELNADDELVRIQAAKNIADTLKSELDNRDGYLVIS